MKCSCVINITVITIIVFADCCIFLSADVQEIGSILVYCNHYYCDI